MISIIVCIAENNAIGYKGNLLYKLRDDLKNFKTLTTNHTVIMGRKTFESLPNGALPHRRNIVLTHGNETWKGTETFPSLEKALDSCVDDGEVFIIGGSSVYKDALPLANRLYLTIVHDTPEEADTFFPDYEKEEWEESLWKYHPADEKNDKDFSFVVLNRKRESN